MLNNIQLKKLEKQWTVKPKGFYITIYAEDFKDTAWEEYCKTAGVNSNISELTVLCFGTK